jgi:hypothetical protein
VVQRDARLHDELRRSEERFRVALGAGRITVYEQGVRMDSRREDRIADGRVTWRYFID